MRRIATVLLLTLAFVAGRCGGGSSVESPTDDTQVDQGGGDTAQPDQGGTGDTATGDQGTGDTAEPDQVNPPDGTGDVTPPPQCTIDADCATALTGLGDCEEAYCDAATRTCMSRPVTAERPCDDGNPCTEDDTCMGGQCLGGPKNCADTNPCTVDSCNLETGACLHEPAASGSCDDDDPCTDNDRCQGGVCAGDPNPACQCENDGDCERFEDGDRCNGTLQCDDSQCVVDPASVVDCSGIEAGPCGEATCNAQTGQCETRTLVNGTLCNDGNACTRDDYCRNGQCVGETISCDDANACTDDTCDPADGCEHANNTAPCDDGDLCTTNDRCAAGACTGTVDPACQCEGDADCRPFEDGNLCNGTLACYEGRCRVAPESVVTCPTVTNPCRESVCGPTTGECTERNRLDGTACSDGTACTASDQCVAGTCTGTAVDCNDRNACTTDTCNTTTGCVHTNNTDACNDNDPCTTGDRCNAGACTGTPDPACVCTVDADCEDDGNRCNGLPRCEGNRCVIDPATVVTCTVPAGIHCRTAACEPDTGLCVLRPVADGGACDDSNACTSGDVCSAGTCVGLPRNCDDGNVCTTDACDTRLGCQHQYNTLPCDDGSDCTQNDVCAAGVCTGTPDPSCVCAATADCAEFEDGDACNGTLICVASKCVVNPTSVVVCDRANDTDCARNVCDPTNGTCGMLELPDGKPCSDGDACTEGDACQDGECVGPTAVLCDDGNPCTDQVCDPQLKCIYTNNTAACDDGDPCTGGDACLDGICQPGETNLCPDTCYPDWTLTCGGTDRWSNDWTGSTNVIDEYPCFIGEYPAPEYTYAFVAPYDGRFTVTLAEEENVLTEALILRNDGAGCNAANCLAWAGGSATVDMEAGDQFHIVVDGWLEEDAAGLFTISIACVPSAETNCTDGLDEDRDSDTDCADSDCEDLPVCAPALCTPAWPLQCGGSDFWWTWGWGSTDVVSDYSCNDYDYSGPEYVYSFTAPADMDITVWLSDETAQTDLMILEAYDGACNPNNCIGETWGWAETISVLEGHTYYFVVDGFMGAQGEYTIHLDCPIATEMACGDGLDNDGDGDADCADADCNGVQGCEYGAEVSCCDGLDNDGDGQSDLADSADCGGVLCIEFDCADGIDNERDGKADCRDDDCALDTACKVLINEVYYDDPGSDGEDVFIELFGPANMPLDGFRLAAVNGTGGAVYARIELTGYSLDPQGYFLIADTTANATLAAVADLLVTQADLQNGPDSIQVEWGADPPLVIDVLGYGTGAPVYEGSPAAEPSDTESLTRDPFHGDLDNNFVDFGACPPTPKAEAWDCWGVSLPETACDDGADNDADGAADCADTDCLASGACATCTPAWDLTCGGSDTWNNGSWGSTDDFETYACYPYTATGPEYIYAFSTPTAKTVTVQLSDVSDGADLEVIVLEAVEGYCSPASCVAFGESGATFDAAANTVYYVVIDGYNDAVADFTLTATCE